MEDALLWHIAEGLGPEFIARRMADDKRKQSAIRRKIYRFLARTDIQEEIAARTTAIKWGQMGAINKAILRKARAGRVDAIKLVYEATGYYNPRLVQHEHTGEIQITIKGANRPEHRTEEYIGEAEVVED